MTHMIGAYTGSVVGNQAAINRMHQFAGFLGRWPDFHMDFASTTGSTIAQQWAAMSDPSIPQGWTKFGAKRFVITMPLIPPAGTLAAAADGDYNANYTNLMTRYQECGMQEGGIIRLGHEFNGNWYPWQASGKEADFVLAWRNAVNFIRNSFNNGAIGSQWMFDWCPTWAAVPGQPTNCNVEACYPGDEYVDVIGLDVYNQHYPFITDPTARWNSIRMGTVGLEWHACFACVHGKPISFPEWGTGTKSDGAGAGDDHVFVRNMAAWIKSHRVLYHAWWDSGATIDCRISGYENPKAARVFRAAFR